MIYQVVNESKLVKLNLKFFSFFDLILVKIDPKGNQTGLVLLTLLDLLKYQRIAIDFHHCKSRSFHLTNQIQNSSDCSLIDHFNHQRIDLTLLGLNLL